MSPLRSRNASAANYETQFKSNSASAAAGNGATRNIRNLQETLAAMDVARPKPATGNGVNKKTKFQTHGSVETVPVLFPSLQHARIRKVLRVIESDPAYSIHDLAALLNLSHSHLQHLFKQETGVQLGHLLLEHRLLKAAQLLENSNMSVKEIAFTVGYEHTSSFIRAFERRFSIAPRGYREQISRNQQW